MAVYLDFEEPIKVLADQLIENKKLQEEKGVNTSKIIVEIAKKLKEPR
jgi:acetyl-CoA carboxylase alpha subunit